MPTETMTTYVQHLEQFRHWLRQTDRSACTVKHYTGDLDQFRRWYQATFGADPDVVRGLDVQAYRQHLQVDRHQMVATINRRIAALRVYCEWQEDQHITPTNEGARVRSVKQAEQPVPQVLTHAETLRLFHAAQGSPRDYAIVQVFVQCGVRLDELRRLTPADVTMGERSGKIRVLGKGGKVREVVLNGTAREAVTAWLAVRPTDAQALFVSQKHGPLSGRAIEALISKLGRKAGITKLHPHALRHLCATNMLEAGGNNLPLVQHVMGHESIVTTRRYIGISEAQLQEAAEKQKANLSGETSDR